MKKTPGNMFYFFFLISKLIYIYTINGHACLFIMYTNFVNVKKRGPLLQKYKILPKRRKKKPKHSMQL